VTAREAAPRDRMRSRPSSSTAPSSPRAGLPRHLDGRDRAAAPVLPRHAVGPRARAPHGRGQARPARALRRGLPGGRALLAKRRASCARPRARPTSSAGSPSGRVRLPDRDRGRARGLARADVLARAGSRCS
jgi:hypothetical protein